MSAKHHVVGVGTYLAVIAALMVLTLITVWAAFQDFGALNTPVALIIAIVKALLVAAIFMHLKYSAKITWVFAISGVAFFLVMIAFVVGDYKGRDIQQRPAAWETFPSGQAAVQH